MVILEHHQGLIPDQPQRVDEVAHQVVVTLGQDLLEGQAEILVDFQMVTKVPQVQGMTFLVWNGLNAQQVETLLDRLERTGL